MKNKAGHLLKIVLSAFLGVTSLLVSFAAASAFETPGRTSLLEVSAMCVAVGLYLAFCQFWVAPRGSSGFKANLPTLVAAVAPLLLVAHAWSHATPWLASGCLGSLVGAMLAQRLTAASSRSTPAIPSTTRGRSSRNCLRAGFFLLLAVAVMISIAVIPLILAGTAHPFNPGPTTMFLAITVAFALLAATLLAIPLWRSRDQAHVSTGSLGIIAFLALFLASGHALASQIGGDGLAVRTASVLLILCAVLGLITTALMAITSVIEDRARLWA